MNQHNRFEKLQEAIELIDEARELVKEALQGTSDYENCKAYGFYGLDQALGNGNKYDTSIYEIMENL
tara:strand:+ start:783 stop:983 length:201 start_codon:yes stop_codon:yes gene_type:complete